MKPDFTYINQLGMKINELRIKLRIKKNEKEELHKKIKLDIKDINETLKKLHKKSQQLRKERELIEERVGKELDKIG